MIVPRTLRRTTRSQHWHLSREGPARAPGAVLGPRDSGQQRSITVPHGQPNRQLVSCNQPRWGRRSVYGMQVLTAGIALPCPTGSILFLVTDDGAP
jgi:hypothetical protein